MALEAETTEGRVVAQRYELREEIARGGMGTVWVARDRPLGRLVALKLMRAQSLEAFPDARERFEREAKAAAALKSSHVVQVHDYGVDDGTPFIAMELLEGESLKDRQEKVGRFTVRETGELLRQVAKGLRAAHRAGLVHRDLKPSNIFLAQRDEDEVVKLLDFGVVKLAMERERDDTASGVLLGTPQYMSPEQARGLKDIDHRADLWSLGVILYTMLTGKNPFESDVDAVGDIVIRVAVGEIPKPSSMNPNLPPSVDAFFAQALNRDRDERFQSIDDLARSFLLHGDISFHSLDFETSTGDGWPSVIPAERASRNEAPTVAAVPRPTVSSSGIRRMLEPGTGGRKLVVAVGVAVALLVIVLVARALYDEPAPADARLADTSTPSVSTTPSAAQSPSPSSSEAPATSPSATASGSPGAKGSASGRPHQARPVPSPAPAPDDEEQPPQWYKDKR